VPLILAAAGVVLLVGAGLARRRVVARVALRDFMRRPGQSAILVAGLLIASLVLSAGLVAGDATEAMFLENVFRVWGPIDVVMGTLSGSPLAEPEGKSFFEDPRILALTDGRTVRMQLPASAEAATGARESFVNLIGVDPAGDDSLGSFETLSGKRVNDPGAAVFVNARLADRLGVGAGQEVTLVTVGFGSNPVRLPLQIAEVLADRGKANFQLRPNAFVRLDLLQQAIGGPGMINQVVLSAKGGVRSQRLLDDLHDTSLVVFNRVPPGQRLPKEDLVYRIAGEKATSIKAAREQSAFFQSVLTGLGAIVALTSMALIVNLFVILGEERRAETAMMRALGLRRGGLLLLGLGEGLLYSMAAAILGAIVGAFLGGYLGGALVDLYGLLLRDFAVEFAHPEFRFRLDTLFVAAGAGFLVSVLAVGFVSFKTSRMSVVTAIRGLPEPPSKGRRTPWLQSGAIVAGLGTLGLGALAPHPYVSPLSALMGGVALIAGCAGLIRRYADPRLGSTLGALVAIGWGLWSYVYLPDFEAEFDAAFAIVTVAAVLVVVAGVALISTNLNLIGKLGRLFGAKARAVVSIATAYPVGYRFRTAMSMAMFALVLYMIGAFAIWGGLASGDFETQSGGFDVYAQSTVPVEGFAADESSAVVGTHFVRYELGYRVEGITQEVDFPVPLYGVDESMAAAEFNFLDKPRGMGEADVWRSLATTSDGAIIDGGTNPGNAKVGDLLVLNSDRGERKLKVIGILDEVWVGALFVSKTTFGELYPTRAVDTAWFIKAAPGVGANRLSRAVEQKYQGVGLDARPVRAIFEESATVQRTFVGLFQLLLKLGLVIGISGLAIAAVRTVLERRHSVGVMRALGFKRWMVGASLVLESLLVATLGCAVGLGAGLFGTSLLVGEQLPGFAFAADWPQVLSALAIVYGAVFLFTLFPAARAATLRPAESVRYVE
jgi:putative ABC transport system permease protein